MSYRQIFLEDLRLAILRCLNEAQGHAVNSALLWKMIQAIHHPATRDQFTSALHWLGEQNLARLSIVEATDLLAVKLLERGQDAATGKARIPGVAEPSPPRR